MHGAQIFYGKKETPAVETGKLETEFGNVKKGHCESVHTIASGKLSCRRVCVFTGRMLDVRLIKNKNSPKT